MENKDSVLLDKLQYEQARVEDAVYEFARKKEEFAEFHCKWTNKSYSDSDYNLPNMIFDFLDAVEGKKIN